MPLYRQVWNVRVQFVTNRSMDRLIDGSLARSDRRLSVLHPPLLRRRACSCLHSSLHHDPVQHLSHWKCLLPVGGHSQAKGHDESGRIPFVHPCDRARNALPCVNRPLLSTPTKAVLPFRKAVEGGSLLIPPFTQGSRKEDRERRKQQ